MSFRNKGHAMNVTVTGSRARRGRAATVSRSWDRLWRVLSWLAGGVFLGNLVVIFGLWLAGGGIVAVHNAGELFTSLGRITGLLAAYLLLVQVLLVARLPFVERFRSFDRLTVWHRRNGKICLYLIVAHVAFITLGYALEDKISVFKEFTTFLSSYAGMVTATFGTIMLVAVALSSFVIVRRKLPYESWYLVHLLSYAGIWLAWFHQVPTGNEFITNAPAARYWLILYVATLVLMVGSRLVSPIVRGVRHRLRVVEVRPEGPGVVSITIAGHDLRRLNARAGQFFLWRFFTRGRWWQSHPFSLSAVPTDGTFRITVKDLGDYSGTMSQVRPGTWVLAEGPFGSFTGVTRAGAKTALIAGGIGITPVRALAEELHGDVVVLYRVIKEEDVVFRDELDGLARERGIRVFYIVGHHASPGGERLMSPDHLLEVVPDLVEREIFVCGPPRMADFIDQNVRAAGVSARHIHVERFAL